MASEQMEKLKNEYVSLLRSTNREGMDKVLEWLKESDFYEAPASTAFHGNYPGGLLEHSMNVAHVAIKLIDMLDPIASDKNLKQSVDRNSVLIAALLHDICKANVYKIEKRNRKVDGRWEEYDGYGVDYSSYPLGHGEKSVILLLKIGLSLTEEEMLAIRWHMSAWDMPFQSNELKNSLNAAREKSVLVSIIQAADGLATAVLE